MRLSVYVITFAVLMRSALAAKNSSSTFRPYKKTQKEKKAMSASRLAIRLLKDYEKSEPPPIDGPTAVEIGIYINSFYAISEQTMDYSLNIYLRQRWVDRRLVFRPFNNEDVHKIKLEDNMWDKIWTPDVFFRNEKQASFHNITTPNRLIFLTNNGTVWYVSKITATLSCPMRLHKYPLDTQHCPMMFESFGYTMDTITYQWMESAVEFDPDITLPQYTLVNNTLEDCSQNYTTGAYPCLAMYFVLKRDIGFYMIQVYVPSVLVVILSWVAFWISIDAIPARVTIGLLTVLTMTTQSAGAREHLPRVSYIKAIDVWMSVCLLFVFASLLEFAVVNVFSRNEIKSRTRTSGVQPLSRRCRQEQWKDKIKEEEWRTFTIVTHNGRDASDTPRHSTGTSLQPDVEETLSLTGNDKQWEPSYTTNVNRSDRRRARNIDQASRRAFPLAFLAFNLIYWLTYIMM